MTQSLVTQEQAVQAVSTYVERAMAFVITDDASFQAAANELRLLKRGATEVETALHFKANTKDAHTAWKNAKATENAVFDEFKRARKIIDDKVAVYRAEEQRKRECELMIQREAARKADEDRRLRDAAEAEARGRDDEAEAIIEAPAPVIIAAPVREAPKAEGVSFTDEWKFRVVNMDLVPDKWKKLDSSLVGKVVRAMKGQTDIPGIEVYTVPGTRVRG